METASRIEGVAICIPRKSASRAAEFVTGSHLEKERRSWEALPARPPRFCRRSSRRWAAAKKVRVLRPHPCETTVMFFVSASPYGGSPELWAISDSIQGGFFLMKKPLRDCALVTTCRRPALGRPVGDQPRRTQASKMAWKIAVSSVRFWLPWSRLNLRSEETKNCFKERISSLTQPGLFVSTLTGCSG
jgi:hypothetical protein